MKIQCDVCNKEEASVFCSADEAALCESCDHRVHHANKLASKHHRFSLLNPSHKEVPRCDICQERRAFLFCREDRAILCRECDLPIHTANEHTQKHNRFLLTGVKLSSNTLNPTSTASSSNGCDASIDSEINDKTDSQPLMKVPDPPPPSVKNTDSSGGGGGGSTSSISQYLIEMLPGWHVEDFLDSSSTSRPHPGYCKTDEFSQFLDSDIESDLGRFSSDDIAVWVPQAPVPTQFPQIESQKNMNGLFKELKEVVDMSPKNNSNKRWSDHGFTVPQISPPPLNKRSRHLW